MNVRASKRISRRWPLVSGLVAVALAGLLGVVVGVRAQMTPFRFDSSWMAEVLNDRSVWLDVPARLMDWLGGGWFGVFVVPVAIIVALCVARLFWAAAFYAIAVVVSVALVQLLKSVFDRARPEDILVHADVGSFPSGHVANAATMAVVLGIILHRWWVWFAGVAFVVLMALSRTYLGAHWVSDTIGGALIGVGIAVIVWAPLAHRVELEWNSR